MKGKSIWWWTGYGLGHILWAIKPLRPRLKRWALRDRKDIQHG